MWPFRRTEKRSSASYGDEVVRLLTAEANANTVDSAALAAVEACVGLWERGLAEATVSPASAALRPVTAPFLALVGRGLAWRGEFVGAIEVADGMVTVLPATSWDVRGADANPLAWRYRVDLSGPSDTVSRQLPAEAVLHVRLADPRSPWRGRSPLSRSKATADLAAELEGGLTREARVPVTRIVTIAQGFNAMEQVRDFQRAVPKGGILTTLIGQSETTQVPTQRYTPARMGPDPNETAEALRSHVGEDIANAYGVPAALFTAQGDGSGQREGWRRFWAGTMQPLAMLLQDELRLKLDTAATVTLESLRASDEDGRSRAVARRAQAAAIFKKMGLSDDEALRRAGL